MSEHRRRAPPISAIRMARGLATVAISGAASRPQDIYAHGLNERLSVEAFYGGLDHWYRLLKELAD